MSRMMEEIRQQPEALERTLAGALRGAEVFTKAARPGGVPDWWCWWRGARPTTPRCSAGT